MFPAASFPASSADLNNIVTPSVPFITKHSIARHKQVYIVCQRTGHEKALIHGKHGVRHMTWHSTAVSLVCSDTHVIL